MFVVVQRESVTAIPIPRFVEVVVSTREHTGGLRIGFGVQKIRLKSIIIRVFIQKQRKNGGSNKGKMGGLRIGFDPPFFLCFSIKTLIMIDFKRIFCTIRKAPVCSLVPITPSESSSV